MPKSLREKFQRLILHAEPDDIPAESLVEEQKMDAIDFIDRNTSVVECHELANLLAEIKDLDKPFPGYG